MVERGTMLGSKAVMGGVVWSSDMRLLARFSLAGLSLAGRCRGHSVGVHRYGCLRKLHIRHESTFSQGGT